MRCLILVIVAACHAALPPVPSKGGPAWVEVTSEHFTVWTDATTADARVLVRELEHLRQVIFGIAFADVVSTTRSLVIAFRNSDEVHAFLPYEFAAVTWPPSNALRQPVIVIAADTPAGEQHVITHELTHLISYNVLPEQPHWFAEGLATYFESVKLDPDRPTVEVGTPLPGRILTVRRRGLVPSARLFACKSASCLDPIAYGTVNALFGYLANERGTELVHYMELIAKLPLAAQDGAWATAFPDLPPDKLDHELAHWVAYGKHSVRTYRVVLRETPMTVRTLGDGDVYAARGFILDLERPKVVPVEIGDALRADPTNVVARMVAATHGANDPATARSVAAAHPDDWRAWWLVRDAVHTGPEADDARAKLCALIAKNPAVLPPGTCPG